MFFHLKIFLRKLRLGGVYTLINIGGLTIGMAAAFIIMLWVYNQWSYDRFHAKDSVLYKLWCHNERDGNFDNVTTLIGPRLIEEYAGFANMSRYVEVEWPMNFDIDDDGGKFALSFAGAQSVTLAVADTGFLNMFSFPLLRGDISTAMEPYSMVLTQSVARRMFRDEDPMGKTISFNDALNFTVRGIIADLPANTNFGFEILIPWNKLYALDSDWYGQSRNNLTFVELLPGVDAKTISASIRDVIGKNTGGRSNTETFMQHISGWHLYNKFEKGIQIGGRIETLRMFALIALLILVIACINFMNMSTAQASKSAKETGIRKVVGASRSSLITRFLGETILVAAFAGACALMIVSMILPFFNAMIGENLSLNPENKIIWTGYAIFVLFTGILAGSYPAFYLSSFQPLKVLKGIFKSGQSLVAPRKVLIVMQFTFAVILITSTLVIHRQIQHAKARNLGYEMSRLISVEINEHSRPTRDLIRRELLETGVAESVTVNFGSMTKSEDKSTGFRWSGMDPNNPIVFERNYADSDFAKTIGLQIVQGRDIDIRVHPADSTAMLLNETAVKVMGFDDPIGEIVYEWNQAFHVIGVVKDFVLESPFDPILPMAIGGPINANGSLNHVNIKLSASGSFAERIQQTSEVYRKFNPNEPFNYQIVEDVYARRFDREQRVISLVSWFAALAVFISCLGLFGLSAYMAENRRKEIGIRKVLGASVFNITALLSKEFLILVTISLVIAIPVAWWAMNRWLAEYAYRTNIPWWLFVAVAALTIGIALITVSFQAVRVAVTNPVNAIKSE